MSYFYAAAGAVTLAATVLFLSGVYFGLGAGGMERVITYPALFGTLAFGGI